ncbi:MAG: heme ABC transporter ATP-binding protein [delta proteobacterium ML8_F1]|nr:MAG: heme ABC transporter ATP-binding protein [delta proteobacterium ML8_F1]
MNRNDEASIAVKLSHITKRFPGIVANDDISLKINKGEIFALLGENGAGKSVLMSILFGLYEPEEGQLWIKGKRVEHFSPREAAKLGVGMVHQHFKLVENYTIAQNIVLGMEPVKSFLGKIPLVDKDRIRDSIQALARRFKLDINPDQLISEVNVATRQKVEILKMLYREADILIFDEPTAILTPQEIDYLMDIIRELREGGKTVILISHKLEEIKAVADRCGILNRGRLVDIRTVASTTTREMANLMVGREVILEVHKAPARFGRTVLEVEDLKVTSREKLEVVKGVSFSVRQGEIFAIAGVAGNGQTEIADAITGLVPITSGRVKLLGREITELTVRERNLSGISYIPEDRQSYGLILDYDLSYNLALRNYFKEPFSSPGGKLNPAEFSKYAKGLIRDFDIRSNRGEASQLRSLSGGNQQKAIIAREIDQDSPLVIFVQPTRGLDVGAIENTWSQILKEREKGKGILLVSLELEEIMTLADTIGVIFNGELLKVKEAKEFSKSEIGEYMMGVKKDA